MKKINLAESNNLDKATLRTSHKIKSEEELNELSDAQKDLTNAYKKLDELQFKYKDTDYNIWKDILRDLLNYDIQTSIQEYMEKHHSN